MKVIKQIDVYLAQKRNVKVIDVVQYDTGIQLVFNVKDFEIPSGTSATLYVQKPSGKFVYQEDEITVEGNAITIDLENQAIAEDGRVPYQVSLTNGSDDITTFEGVMLVQKSLKDAGAIKSSTVIRAFDNAVNDRVAEFKTRAEQIATNVIATIPEDYQVMEAKVNEMANAIKGNLSGAVVFADDVSPVEHKPSAKVLSRNKFDINNYVTEKDYSNGKMICAISAENLVIGKEYKVFSKVPLQWFKISNSATGYSCVGLQNDTVGFTSYTFVHQRNVNIPENQPLNIYVNNLEKTAMYDTSIMASMEICIVEVGESDEYTPYIDPSTVTVRRCGKNLLNPIGASSTLKGVTFTNNGDGTFTVKGTSTGAVSFALTDLNTSPMHLSKGQAYTQSVIVVSGTKDENASVVPAVKDADGNILWNYFDDNRTKTATDDYDFYAYTIYVNSGATVDLTFKVQLEVGDVATNYEAFKDVSEYIPLSDGTVEGITSLSPNMTILTDTEGVAVECEYIKDTNKVVQKICDALGIEV